MSALWAVGQSLVVPLMASNVPVHITHTRPPAHDDDGDDDDDDDDDFSLYLCFIRAKD